jgi:hypothetical protein
LFLIVGEVLNAIVKQATEIVEVVGIKVPNKVQQQILSQYANDIKFTILILSIKVLSIKYFLKVFLYGELKDSIQ